jgi:predicted permease
LKGRPAFAAGIVLTLGLGIGANTAMFGIVDRLLFRPPAHLQDAERVHRVYLSALWNGSLNTERNFEYLRYLDLNSFSSSFDASAVFDTHRTAIGTGEHMREVNVTAASASLFEFFAVRPVLGRFFTEAEDRVPAGEHVVVLSHAYWQSAFGASNGVLGQSLQIGDASYTIIGVAPRDFNGLSETAAIALFIPVTAFAYNRAPGYADNYGWSWLEMVVRRKPAVSVAAARTDLTAAYAQSWELQRQSSPGQQSATDARVSAEIASVLLGRGPQAGPETRVVAWVMGVAVIVLLIACANVINLLLARSVQRRREIALRLALGVSRPRLLQQLVTETLLLAFLGGALGLALAQWGGHTLRALFLPDETVGAVAGDVRTLLFTAGSTLALALLTGIAPALQALGEDVASTLRAGARDSGYRRSVLRSALLVFQGALSVLLLVGAGLFVRSLLNVRSLRLGYDVDSVVLIERELRGTELSRSQRNVLEERSLAAALEVPGVRSATRAISVPFWSTEGRGAPYVEGRDSLAKLGWFRLQAGSPEYFETVGTRIVRGRAFTSADNAGAPPVVVVNQTMAGALWPGEDAIGQRMRIGNDTMPFLTVIGIAEDMRALALEGPEFWYYLPVDQFLARFGSETSNMFVRVDGRAENFVEPLRSRIQRSMPGAAFVRATAMRNVVAPQQRAWQLGATMFVAFAGLALALAAIGLYSVVAYGVAARTRELGVRIALGATLGNIAQQVIGHGVAFAAAGIAIGGAIALLAARWIEPLLFDAPARDPLVFGIVTAILLVVALLATVRPALRATRVDPTIALRAE